MQRRVSAHALEVLKILDLDEGIAFREKNQQQTAESPENVLDKALLQSHQKLVEFAAFLIEFGIHMEVVTMWVKDGILSIEDVLMCDSDGDFLALDDDYFRKTRPIVEEKTRNAISVLSRRVAKQFEQTERGQQLVVQTESALAEIHKELYRVTVMCESLHEVYESIAERAKYKAAREVERQAKMEEAKRFHVRLSSAAKHVSIALNSKQQEAAALEGVRSVRAELPLPAMGRFYWEVAAKGKSSRPSDVSVGVVHDRGTSADWEKATHKKQTLSEWSVSLNSGNISIPTGSLYPSLSIECKDNEVTVGILVDMDRGLMFFFHGHICHKEHIRDLPKQHLYPFLKIGAGEWAAVRSPLPLPDPLPYFV